MFFELWGWGFYIACLNHLFLFEQFTMYQPKVSQFNLSALVSHRLRLAIALVFCLSLSACGLFGGKKPNVGPQAAKGSIEALYKEAREELDSGAYTQALELLEKGSPLQ